VAVSVAIRCATVRYPGTTLFEDLDLTLEGGRWTCLLGPSGAGKTSLLRLLAGLIGDYGVVEAECDDGQPLHGRIAYMAQQDLLLPWADALDNVLIGARLRGAVSAEHRARATRLLQIVGLEHQAHQFPAALSGGMRQRVALARTLFEQRPVLLMDEPFSALDAITRHRLQAQAAELTAGKTVLLITHDPLEALRLGHRIQVLSGTPARLGVPLIPPADPPRAIDAPGLAALRHELWRQLAA
jgi:putative hydroxymethylpyrimidine transport system ATP-binding protein